MAARTERGFSAPPEVVFNTAIDPDRLQAWLPVALRQEASRSEIAADQLRACWRTEDDAGWLAELSVVAVDAGGSTAQLRLDATADQPLNEMADEALTRLARVVADNLTAG